MVSAIMCAMAERVILDELERGRESYAGRKWAEAHELLLAMLGPVRPSSIATLLDPAPPNTESATVGLTAEAPPSTYARASSVMAR